ncbi:glycine betaine ABC transport system, glycine betaine-binding protein OpuAC [Geomicrobium sp. JCM 19037]|uniref:glycine betaine ABC transporter substrate-binding protein n=1 Tax=unclassified Geomicrobium TaxID=2628951 RepID=UPI00045F2371|nr:glycine betaine ABC transporter substrate-binding protein [Geomicrobium sp. JCM 19037]GAK01948.1 glycine betaine ABC transport system, glycine betaine-binding protein OpuAC [Geomicrobium sp. JCM 19037]
MKKNWQRIGLASALSFTLVAAGCGTDDGDDNGVDSTDDNGTGEEADDEDDTDDNGETANYGEEVNYTIVGIDPGAGVVAAAEQAIEDYDLEGWSVQTSSSAAMTQELANAYENEEPILVTGWTPHWKFEAMDLKILDDPELSFGEAESIHTIVREGLEEDQPEGFAVLDNFAWTAADMDEVMLEISEGVAEEEAAQNWIDANEDVVSEWTADAGEVDGESIDLAYVPWETEIASTNVVALVLESIGYEVNMSSMEANIMFTAIANGDADGMVAAWLPYTHEEYYAQMEDQFVDLGPNVDGEAALGLTVPSYMNIDSIEDLRED